MCILNLEREKDPKRRPLVHFNFFYSGNLAVDSITKLSPFHHFAHARQNFFWCALCDIFASVPEIYLNYRTTPIFFISAIILNEKRWKTKKKRKTETSNKVHVFLYFDLEVTKFAKFLLKVDIPFTPPNFRF